MKKLYPGDTMALTIGVNLPTGDRSSPWIRVESTSTTTIQEGESYKDARARLEDEVYKRNDAMLNRLVQEAKEAKEA